MIGVFDTSAVIKLVIEEVGTDETRRLWSAISVPCLSSLVYPEATAAIARADQAGRIDGAGAARARTQLRIVWEGSATVALDRGLAEQAGDVATVSGLKGADAVHLATALGVGGSDTVFVTWDRALSRVARELGLAVAP